MLTEILNQCVVKMMSEICDKGFVNFLKSNFNLWRLLMMIVNFMGLWKGFDSKLLNFYDQIRWLRQFLNHRDFSNA